MNEGISFLQSATIPHELSKCALILYHYSFSFLHTCFPSTVIAAACLAYATKVRPIDARIANKFIDKHNEDHIVIELCLEQLLRHKIVLIESFFRKTLQHMQKFNSHIANVAENITRVAVILLDKVYQTKYCLFPSCAAAATLTFACKLIGLKLNYIPWEKPEMTQEILYKVFGVPTLA